MPHQLPPVEDDIYDYLVAQAVPLQDDVNSFVASPTRPRQCHSPAWSFSSGTSAQEKHPEPAKPPPSSQDPKTNPCP